MPTGEPVSIWNGSNGAELGLSNNANIDSEAGLDIISEAGLNLIIENGTSTPKPVSIWTSNDGS